MRLLETCVKWKEQELAITAGQKLQVSPFAVKMLHNPFIQILTFKGNSYISFLILGIKMKLPI